MNIFLIVGAILFVIVAVNLWWRWRSQRHSLPCPTWMAGILEGGLMNRLLGTNTTLNRIGLRLGQRVLEVGPGPGGLVYFTGSPLPDLIIGTIISLLVLRGGIKIVSEARGNYVKINA